MKQGASVAGRFAAKNIEIFEHEGLIEAPKLNVKMEGMKIPLSLKLVRELLYNGPILTDNAMCSDLRYSSTVIVTRASDVRELVCTRSPRDC